MKTWLHVRLLVMLKMKEGMPSGASPSLVAWIFLEYYLGVPWESPNFGSCHSLFSSYRYLTQNLKTSITQNLTKLCEIFFFFQAEDGIRDLYVTGVQTCALPI